MSRSYSSAKQLVMQAEFKTKRERSKRTDYTRKGKDKFDYRKVVRQNDST